MVRDVQHIRRSQFVLIYGPGALIESKNGPRIIPSINHGLGGLFSKDEFQKFEITESRLRIAIRNLTQRDARVFSLPSNASLGKPDTRGIYHTYVFPVWKICYGRRGGHPKNLPVLYSGIECPVCHRRDDSSAVRFVAACPDGHLDEVNWNYAVHRDRNCNQRCRPPYYYWRTGGSSLSDIVVECPRCGCRTDMGKIYSLDFECSGRLPEKESPSHRIGLPSITKPKRPYKEKCDQKMKVLQRQSSSLHIPETVTLLTIPEYDNAISNILQRTAVSSAVDAILNSPLKPCEGGIDIEDLISWIRSSLTGRIPDESIQVVEEYIREKGIFIFCELFRHLHNEERTFIDFVYEELESLLAGPRTTDNFSMSPPRRIQSRPGDVIPDIDVYPVEMLKTITAQIGYRRMPYTKRDPATGRIEIPKLISSGVYLVDDSIWYPGFEGRGEGIFITFSDGNIPEFSESRAHEEWRRYGGSSNLTGTPWGDIPREPLFVWLHTLSHALIMAISLHSGYSSASLRERVYINRNADNGGILIYTTSPGEDGSMGGLIGAVDIFEEILKMASERIRLCSNDPLCSEVRKTPERINGAACHSCLLISETSCEHRNMWLDRHIILRD